MARIHVTAGERQSFLADVAFQTLEPEGWSLQTHSSDGAWDVAYSKLNDISTMDWAIQLVRALEKLKVPRRREWQLSAIFDSLGIAEERQKSPA